MYAAAHILLTYAPRRAAKAGTVCAFRELCVLAEGNCSNHTQIKTSQYREQGYLNTGTEGWEEGRGRCGEGARTHRHNEAGSGSLCVNVWDVERCIGTHIKYTCIFLLKRCKCTDTQFLFMSRHGQ